MNKVMLMGRLTRDPEIRSTQTGVTVASFTLAVDKNLSKEQKEENAKRNLPTADFIRCIAFNKIAEVLERYLAKGCRLIVSDGRIQTRTYQDKNGANQYITEVVANSVEIIDFASSKDERQGYHGYEDYGFDGQFVPNNDDNIPF